MPLPLGSVGTERALQNRYFLARVHPEMIVKPSQVCCCHFNLLLHILVLVDYSSYAVFNVVFMYVCTVCMCMVGVHRVHLI